MDILEIVGVPHFKKGSGIHIKKKNRGKFTEYCGGKVTDECIKRAKKSKNPKLRKRATFAANARKWKHAEGGIIKAQLGTMFLTPHPLSPVGIALNQVKATAKNKKDQTYLPPGVKEVIGPDGKKIVIRTEQPLKPLEQGIAEWLPGTGDIAEFGHVTNDLKEGRYGTAVAGAGLLLIPGAFGKFLNKYRKTVRTANNVEDVMRKANTAEYINSIDDVTLDPFSIAEVPESAFIPKEKEVIQLSPTHVTKEKEKFVEDVVAGAHFARKHAPKKPELKEFKLDEFFFLDGMPIAGEGAESVVYLGDDIVYKRPKHILQHRITRFPGGGSATFTPLPEFRDIQSVVKDSETYLGDINKYWFQEPVSLEGYFKWPGTSDRYLPVYSQPRGVTSIDFTTTPEAFRQYSYLTEKIPHSNILLENDLPIPHDTHAGNFMVFPDGVVRAVDIHKDGGKLNKYKK